MLERAADRMNRTSPSDSQPPSILSAPLGAPWWAWIVMALALGLAIFH
jgi:hypothetical protein